MSQMDTSQINNEISQLRNKIKVIHERLPALSVEDSEAVYARNRLNERIDRLTQARVKLNSNLVHLEWVADRFFGNVIGQIDEKHFSGSRRVLMENYIQQAVNRIRLQHNGISTANSHENNLKRVAARIRDLEAERDDLNVIIDRLISEKYSLKNEESKISQLLMNLIHKLQPMKSIK